MIDRRSTHHVHCGVESLPCYCEAKYDHAIGQESPTPAVLAPVDVMTRGADLLAVGGHPHAADELARARADVMQMAADLAAAREDTKRLDWLVANVKEQLTAGSLKGEQPIEHRTQYVLPTLIAWADFCGPITLRESIDAAIALQEPRT